MSNEFPDSPDGPRFPNETVATILEESAADLIDGSRSYAEVRSILCCLLMLDDDVIPRDGSLGKSGRISFGRKRAGDDGVALWIPSGAFDGEFESLPEGNS